MGIEKYKFAGPGVQIEEIDNSQLPREPQEVGPVVIGRLQRGPGLRPVTVQSFSEFIDVFGDPIPGGKGGDVWRDGNNTAPTYAAYAAQAWLKNSSPITIVRLLGAQQEDCTTAGEAGWETKDSAGAANVLGATDAAGGAYGLFIIDSGSTDRLTGLNTSPATGALAAIFYINEGSIVLTGSDRAGATTSGSAVLIKSIGLDKEFKAIIRDGNSNVVKTTTFNFNVNSKKYIRKVFNTNPILTNTDVTTGVNTASYWLGETFDRHLNDTCTATYQFGMILGLKGDAATREGCDFRAGSQAAKTGWVFSQDLQSVTGAANSFNALSMTKLFRFVGLDTGEWMQSNLKVSIQDIKSSTNSYDPYGSFTVLIRKAEDSDNAVRVVEQFNQCNLNPFSPNYIAKKIGDKYVTWDDNDRAYREYGNYSNVSKFVRVEMNQDVDAAAVNPLLLPFGVYGPIRHKGFSILSGSSFYIFGANNAADGVFTQVHAKGGEDGIVRPANVGINVDIGSGATSFTGSFLYPSLALRTSSAGGNIANPKYAYFGMDNSINSSTVRNDPGYCDYVRMLPAGYDSFTLDSTRMEYSWIFTLDDIVQVGVNGVYVSGSRALGSSITAADDNNYQGVLDAGFDRFTFPFYGGFDGLDITEKEPFNNTDLESGTPTTNYAYNSVKRAIDSIADPELVEINLACMPGITNESLTEHLIKTCEDRGDALAIVDLKGGFIPSTENTDGDSSAGNRGSVDTTITNLRNRGLNTSYGCGAYPWVQARDTINGATIWIPSSIVELGAMSYGDKTSELWFAPAGFTRGGLTNGAAGIPVVGVRERLTSEQRDKLYAANINPIASFPSAGIVVYGQKTFQTTPSALDRINVRRMVIHVKRELARMAETILFDQNVKVTWNRFLGKAKPFLESIKSRLGLEDYKLILDETTTTAELKDRNIVYAKCFLKPAKSIEYIAIDVNITNSSENFED